MHVKVEIKGRDFIEVFLDQDKVKVNMIGCVEFLDKIHRMKSHFGDNIQKWPLPSGEGHVEMMIRELILKLRGEWKHPYEHEELCHCRNIPTEKVDQAILSGALTPETVSRWTSASTACGTCRPSVEEIIKYRKAN